MTPLAPTDPTPGSEHLALRVADDVIRTRHRVREISAAAGFDLVTQTKLVTAVSELARNAIVHGGGGTATIRLLLPDGGQSARTGILVEVDDDGPGIADMANAMTGGWSTGTGLGLGLPGSKRLVHEFDIDAAPGHGTHVRITVWRRGR